MKMQCCHVNDGANRIQKQVLRPRNRNFEAGILTDDPALVAAASNIAPTLPKKLKPGRFGFSVNVKCHAFLKISRSFLTESVKEDDISLGLKVLPQFRHLTGIDNTVALSSISGAVKM